MTACCSYPYPHLHYPDWLRGTVISDPCRPKDGSVCGKHPRTWSVGALMSAWSRRTRQTRHGR